MLARVGAAAVRARIDQPIEPASQRAAPRSGPRAAIAFHATSPIVTATTMLEAMGASVTRPTNGQAMTLNAAMTRRSSGSRALVASDPPVRYATTAWVSENRFVN